MVQNDRVANVPMPIWIMSQCPSAGTRLVVYYVYTSKQYIYEYTLSTKGPPADDGNRQVGSRMTFLAVSKSFVLDNCCA